VRGLARLCCRLDKVQIFRSPGSLPPPQPFPRRLRALLLAARGRPRGGAVRGLWAWALSAVLICRRALTCQVRQRDSRVPFPAPSQRQLREFGCPPGSLSLAPGAPWVPPLPPPARRQPPFPPAPPTAPPRRSQVPPFPPYLSRPPPPSRSFASSGHVAGCLRPEPAPDPPLGAPEPPVAPAPPPRSLAATDGVAAGAGAAEPRAQLARRGEERLPNTHSGPGPRRPVAP
jgi:hypothetical protein